MTTKELRKWCDKIDGFHCSCSSCKELQAASKIMRAAADVLTGLSRRADGLLVNETARALEKAIQETSVPK